MKKKKMLFALSALFVFTMVGCNKTTKTLSDISVSATQSVFNIGDTVSKSNFTVTATYSDSSTATVTSFTIADFTDDKYTLSLLDVGETTFTVTYTENSVTKTKDIDLVVNNTSDACFSLTALSDNTSFYLNKMGDITEPNIKYSTDSGVSWKNATFNNPSESTQIAVISDLKKGETIYLKGTNTSGFSQNENDYIYIDALDSENKSIEFKPSGNIMYLIDETGKSTTIPTGCCFYSLFGRDEANSRTPLACSSPSLPATTLADSCYEKMFYCCTSLKRGPSLVATTPVKKCYKEMFYGNTSLDYIEYHFTEFSESTDATKNWVNGDDTYKMSTSGVFRCPEALKSSESFGYGENKSPKDWKVVTF